MAYISRYKYDIFISYVHDDNYPLPSDKDGWVTQFVEYLSSFLTKSHNLEGLEIWFDQESLQGNTAFNPEIQKGIEQSALFFVLNSNKYKKSEYCRKELNWFFDKNTEQDSGVMVDNYSRVFNICINNIHHSEWPKKLNGTGSFTFHDAGKDEEEFGYPSLCTSISYTYQLRELGKAAIKILKSMAEANKDNIKTSSVNNLDKVANKKSRKIFIANIPESAQLFQRRVIQEIQDDVVIIPPLELPCDLETHQQKLSEALDQSSLSIHLLDKSPGLFFEGSDELTYTRVQADTVKDCDSESLIWVPDTLKDETIEDKAQATWLKELETGPRKSTGFHFIRSSEQEFIEQVKQKLSQQNSPTNNISLDTRFLIDTHQKDQFYAYQVASILSEKGLDVNFNKVLDDPVKNLENFQLKIEGVHNLIIMFGSVAPAWLKGRIQEAVKVVTEQFSTGTPLLEDIWVCLLPSSPGEQAIPQIPLIKISCLDISNSKTIEASIIDRLLS